MTSPRAALESRLEEIRRSRERIDADVRALSDAAGGHEVTSSVADEPGTWQELRDYTAAKQMLASTSPVAKFLAGGFSGFFRVAALGRRTNMASAPKDEAFRDVDRDALKQRVAQYEAEHPAISLLQMRTTPGNPTVPERLDDMITLHSQVEERRLAVARDEQAVGRTIAAVLGMELPAEPELLVRNAETVAAALDVLGSNEGGATGESGTSTTRPTGRSGPARGGDGGRGTPGGGRLL